MRVASTGQRLTPGASVPSNPTLTATSPDSPSGSPEKRNHLGHFPEFMSGELEASSRTNSRTESSYDRLIERCQKLEEFDLPAHVEFSLSVLLGSLDYLKWFSANRGCSIEQITEEDLIAEFALTAGAHAARRF